MSLNIKKQSLEGLQVQKNNKNVFQYQNQTISDDEIADMPVKNISAKKLIEISEQDFGINEDNVDSIAESIRVNGQIEPCIVTPANDKGFYYILAGRHRKRACEKLKKPVKCIVLENLSEDDKQLIIIDTNINRNNDYKPSELAFAYLHKKELLRKKSNSSSLERIAGENNSSVKKIYRYIRLTYLSKELLEMVDNGIIPVIAGSELSYLSAENQEILHNYLANHSDVKITTDISKKIKKICTDSVLDSFSFDDIFYSTNTGVSNVSNGDTADTADIVDTVDTVETATSQPVNNPASDPVKDEEFDNSDISSVSENSENSEISENSDDVFDNRMNTEDTTVTEELTEEEENTPNQTADEDKDEDEEKNENITFEIKVKLTAEEIKKLGFSGVVKSVDIANAIKDLINNI
ncbi:MAG: ParB/RepB/Spo0J family partition protein [Ruminococcus sp.]